MSKQRIGGQVCSDWLIALVNLCSGCTPSPAHTRQQKVCGVTVASWGECHTIGHAFLKAVLCKTSPWSQYTVESKQREKERGKNWGGLERPLHKNKAG